MNVQEFALVAFSILTQMSVGAFIVLGIFHYWAARRAGEAEADRLADRALLAIGPTLVLGLLASLFHLGSPLNAYLAILNVGSSWLSREILFGVLFAGLCFVFTFMQWRKLSTARVRSLLRIVTAIVGVVLVYVMSEVYRLAAQPAWNTIGAPVTFFATTLLLGALAMGAAFVANYTWMQRQTPGCSDVQCGLLRDSLRWIALASIILLGIEFVAIPLQLANLSSGPIEAVQSAALMVTTYQVIFVLRLALVFLGVAILGMFIYQNASSIGRERVAGYLAYGAFALVLVAEVLGRYLFYAAHVRIGI